MKCTRLRNVENTIKLFVYAKQSIDYNIYLMMSYNYTYFCNRKFHDALHVLWQIGVYHEQSPVVCDLTDHQSPHGAWRQHGHPRYWFQFVLKTKMNKWIWHFSTFNIITIKTRYAKPIIITNKRNIMNELIYWIDSSMRILNIR